MLNERKIGFYEKYIKRLLDIVFAVLAIGLLSWLLVILAIIVRIKIGSPVLFKQARPGLIDSKNRKEKIFNMYKFRSMSNEKNEKGELLPDEERLGKFGKTLRGTSLDELPELFNILKGDMSFIGPRPQLVRDMVFMNEKQRMRHTARPGLSGLAQIMGRNAIAWEKKFEWDLKYIDTISFKNDSKIIWLTMKKILGRNENENELDITDDFGDYLLKIGKISQEYYVEKKCEAERIIAQAQINK